MMESLRDRTSSRRGDAGAAEDEEACLPAAFAASKSLVTMFAQVLLGEAADVGDAVTLLLGEAAAVGDAVALLLGEAAAVGDAMLPLAPGVGVAEACVVGLGAAALGASVSMPRSGRTGGVPSPPAGSEVPAIVWGTGSTAPVASLPATESFPFTTSSCLLRISSSSTTMGTGDEDCWSAPAVSAADRGDGADSCDAGGADTAVAGVATEDGDTEGAAVTGAVAGAKVGAGCCVMAAAGPVADGMPPIAAARPGTEPSMGPVPPVAAALGPAHPKSGGTTCM
jgi:hypothetical protein